MELTREIRDLRIAICQDMLAQMAREDIPLNIRSNNGYFNNVDFQFAQTEPTDWANLAGFDLKEYADQAQRECAVCQIGGLMLSKARVADVVPLRPFVVDDYGDRAVLMTSCRAHVVAALADVFDEETLLVMESAFECYPLGYDCARLASLKFNRYGDYKESSGWREEHGRLRALSCGGAVFGMNIGRGGDLSRERAEAVCRNTIAHDGVFVVEPVSNEEEYEAKRDKTER